MVQGPPWSPESSWCSTKVKSFQQCCPQHQKCISIQPNPKRVHSSPSNQSYGGTRDFSPISLKLALSHESKGTWWMCFPWQETIEGVCGSSKLQNSHTYMYMIYSMGFKHGNEQFPISRGFSDKRPPFRKGIFHRSLEEPRLMASIKHTQKQLAACGDWTSWDLPSGYLT